MNVWDLQQEVIYHTLNSHKCDISTGLGEERAGFYSFQGRNLA